MVEITEVVLRKEALACMVISIASLSFMIWPFRKNNDSAANDSGAQESTNNDADSVYSSEETSDEYINQGVRLAMQGNIDRAARRFRRALDSDPNDAAAHYNLALALDMSGKHAEAKSHYERAAELDPTSVDASINLGITLLDSEDIESAIKELEKAVALNSKDFLAQYNLGCAYMKTEQYRKAVPRFIEASKIDPKNPETRFNLAIASRESGCHNLAENELREFLILAGDRFPIQSKYAKDLLGEHKNGD